MGGGTGPIIQNTTVYKLGWGQLNQDGNVNLAVKFYNLQLDIVGFLAILGEGSVLASAPVATLSKVIFLPRLLPAPQALLRPFRPDKLLSSKGWATAVHSGNDRDYINFIGHHLANAESLPQYSVKCVEIKRKPHDGEVKAKLFGPTSAVAVLGCFLSLSLFAISVQQQDGMGMLAVICLSFLSTLIGVGNKWTLNLPKRNAPGQFTPPGDVVMRYPKGNFVVVRCSEDVARELYFAPEEIEYLVEHPWKYRMIALVGTIMLMFGVIFLGNAGTNTQVAYAASFMVLNAAYWIVAALPQRYHWNMDCFEVIPQTFSDRDIKLPCEDGEHQHKTEEKIGEVLEDRKEKKSKDKGKGKGKGILNGTGFLNGKRPPKTTDSTPRDSKRKPYVSYNKTFTEALWKVIIATRDIQWIKRSKTAPDTAAWNDWLCEALSMAQAVDKPVERLVGNTKVTCYEIPDWNPQKALGQCIKEHQEADERLAAAKTAQRLSARLQEESAEASAEKDKTQASSSSAEV